MTKKIVIRRWTARDRLVVKYTLEAVALDPTLIPRRRRPARRKP